MTNNKKLTAEEQLKHFEGLFMEHLRARWYGKVDNVIIQSCSSGTYKITIESSNLHKYEFDNFISDLFTLIRASPSVEC